MLCIIKRNKPLPRWLWFVALYFGSLLVMGVVMCLLHLINVVLML